MVAAEPARIREGPFNVSAETVVMTLVRIASTNAVEAIIIMMIEYGYREHVGV